MKRKYYVKDIGNGFGDEGREDNRLAVIAPNHTLVILLHLRERASADKLVRILNRKKVSK